MQGRAGGLPPHTLPTTASCCFSSTGPERSFMPVAQLLESQIRTLYSFATAAVTKYNRAETEINSF